MTGDGVTTLSQGDKISYYRKTYYLERQKGEYNSKEVVHVVKFLFKDFTFEYFTRYLIENDNASTLNAYINGQEVDPQLYGDLLKDL